jgi:hypothetical protein
MNSSVACGLSMYNCFTATIMLFDSTPWKKTKTKALNHSINMNGTLYLMKTTMHLSTRLFTLLPQPQHIKLHLDWNFVALQLQLLISKSLNIIGTISLARPIK